MNNNKTKEKMNMRKFYYSLAMLLLAFTFSACSQDDANDNNRFTIDPVNWMQAKFPFNSDGTMQYVPTHVFKTAEEMQKALVGKAFKHSFSYQIDNKTGRVDQDKYYSHLFAFSPHHFYFRDNKMMYVMDPDRENVGEYIADGREWSYVEDLCIIKQKFPYTTLDVQKYNDIQILEYDAKYQYIWVTQIVTQILDGKKEMPGYVLSRYDLMSQEEFSPYSKKLNGK